MHISFAVVCCSITTMQHTGYMATGLTVHTCGTACTPKGGKDVKQLPVSHQLHRRSLL